MDVVDVDQAAGLVAGRDAASTLFSPQNRDYDVGGRPAARSTRRRRWPRPRPPESPAAAAGRHRGRDDLVRRARDAVRRHGRATASSASPAAATPTSPTGAAERLDGVRIPIWSTKSFTARWFGPAGPARSRPTSTRSAPTASPGPSTNRLDVAARGRDPRLRQAGLPARRRWPRGRPSGSS